MGLADLQPLEQLVEAPRPTKGTTVARLHLHLPLLHLMLHMEQAGSMSSPIQWGCQENMSSIVCHTWIPAPSLIAYMAHGFTGTVLRMCFQVILHTTWYSTAAARPLTPPKPL
jgi:hypothetical protein